MRYISLGLGRSDYRLQEWTIGVGPLKEIGLRTGSRPVPVAAQVHSRKPLTYKPLYKLRGLVTDQVHRWLWIRAIAENLLLINPFISLGA
jgi:hypothetical protein